MFDPETVEQHGYCDGEQMYVTASDYDQLLELYRAALASREAYAKGLMTMRQPAEV